MKLYQEDICKLHINYLKCSTAESTHSSVYTQTTLLQVKGAIQEKASSEGSGTPRHRLPFPLSTEWYRSHITTINAPAKHLRTRSLRSPSGRGVLSRATWSSKHIPVTRPAAQFKAPDSINTRCIS